MLYKCSLVRSMEYCTGLFVWGLEVCGNLVVGGVCVAGAHTPLPQPGEHKHPVPTQTDLYNTL